MIIVKIFFGELEEKIEQAIVAMVGIPIPILIIFVLKFFFPERYQSDTTTLLIISGIYVISLIGLINEQKVKNSKLQNEKEQEDLKNKKLAELAEKKAKEEADKNRLAQEEQAKWQLELDREIERERRLAEVRNNATLDYMKVLIDLYAKYKEKGLSVEKEIFDMRAKLLELEGQENKAMIQDLVNTLDSLA